MKHNFKFLTLSRVFNDCRDSVGRLSTLILLLFALSFGFSSQAWANNGFVKATMWYNVNNENKSYDYYNNNGDINLETLTTDFKLTGLTIEVWDDWSSGSAYTQAALYWDGNGEYKTNEKTGKSGNNYQFKAQNCNFVIIKHDEGNSGTHTKEYWMHVWGPETYSGNNWIKNGNNNCKWTYTILPPAVSNFGVTPSGAVAGTGTENDPYLIANGTSLTLTVSGSQEHADANSSFQVKFGSDTYSSTTTKTISDIKNKNKQSIVVKARYYNSSESLASANEVSQTIYYIVPQTALTLDKNNSDAGSSNGSANVTLGVASFSPTQPSRIGYTNKGYYKTADCLETDYISTASGALQANTAYTDGNKKWTYSGSTLTLHTKWQATGYKVTLDQTDATTEATYKQPSVTYDAALPTINNGNKPSRDYYNFAGYWTSNGKTSGEWGSMLISDAPAWQEVTGYTATVNSNLVWKRAENVTVYPKWTPIVYSYTFEQNGGSGATDGTYTYESDAITLPTASEMSKTGYSFEGWYTEPEFTNKVTEIPTQSNGNKRFYANWTANQTTVTLKANGGKEADQTFTATFDAIVDASAKTPNTRDGYNLKGYFTDPSNGSIVLNADLTVRVSDLDGWIKRKTVSSVANSYWVNPNTTADLYAQWQAHQWTITLNDNGGTGGSGTKTATYGATTGITSVNVPTRTNYSFAGYYDDQEGEGVQVYNAVGNLLAEAGTYTDGSRNWIYDNNVTLYAKWNSVGNYVVTLSAGNDATTTGTTSVNVQINTTTGLTENITCPTKTGYTFGGYFTEIGGSGTKLINADGSWVIPATDYINNAGEWIYANNVTLKAKWDANSTQVTFDKQDGTGGTTSRKLTFNSTDFGQAFESPAKTGYTFGGYFTETNGEGIQLISAEGAWIAGVEGYTDNPIKWIKTTTDPLTLYAKWTENLYDLVVVRQYVDADGNPINIGDFVDVTEPTRSNAVGIATPYPIPEFASGYKGFHDFKWRVAAGAKVKCGESPTTDASTETKDIIGSTEKSTITITGYKPDAATGTITVYDCKKETYYTLDVSAVNGTIQGGAASRKVGIYTATNVTAEANIGYDFQNWTITPTSDHYTITLETPTSPITNVNVSSTNRNASNAGSITANFVAHTYNITYANMGGATNFENAPATYTVETETISLGTPTKTGYTFTGWKLTNAGGAGITEIAQGSHEDITLWATWSEILYTITLTNATTASVQAGIATHPSITANAAPVGQKFKQWNTTGGATVASTTSANTTVTATAEGTVTAEYEEVPTVFFKNTLGWSNVYVIFFNEDAYREWDNIQGVHPHRGKDRVAEYGTLTLVPGTTDIYYCSYDAAKITTGYIAFSNADMHTWNDFSGNKASYRGDFASCQPLFIPNTNQTSKDNNTEYYSDGRWTSYSTASEIYMVGIDDDWSERAQYQFAKETITGTSYTLDVTLSEVGHNYTFKLRKCGNGEWYGVAKDETAITSNHCTDIQFYGGNDYANCTLTSTVAGTYTFTYDITTKKLSVEYPAMPAPASITVTAERYYGEDKINTFIATDPAYQVYTDEKIVLTIDAVEAPTGCTTYYQFGTSEASTERTFTIENPTTAADQSIEAKVFFRPNSGGKDGDAKSETIAYQGVVCPSINLSTSWNEAQEGVNVPDNVTVYYAAGNYNGPATVTRSKDGAGPVAFMNIASGNQAQATYTLLDKNVQRQTFVATAEVNGRTFSATKAISIYRLVEITITDADNLMNHYYMWEDGTNPTRKEAEWPGNSFFSTLGNAHIFYVKYPSYTHFVLNNGKQAGEGDAIQTVNVTLPDQSTCYTIGTQVTEEEDPDKGKYQVEVAAQCPNKLYVGDIDEVSAVQGEGVIVSPQVDIDPLLDANSLVISFNYLEATGISCDQRGRSFMVTATAGTGTYNIQVTYSIPGAKSVTKPVTINVTSAIMIQAKYGNLGWSDHNEIYIHYWGTDVNATQKMTWKDYVGEDPNKQDRVYARIPLGTDNKINFQIYAWNMNENWHVTEDVIGVTESGCYTIGVGSTKRSITRDDDYCWTAYYVEIDMNNGTVYRSNTVEDLSQTVSFFAPGASEENAKAGLVRIICNGSQTATIATNTFDKSGIYTAKIAGGGTGLTDVEYYTGDYYIRTDGASGGWNDYKKASHKFTNFSLYNGAKYNYYWVANVKEVSNKTTFNIKGCVGNEYNENLANMIESDNYTDGTGNITVDDGLGVNLRFGYNPQTNHFERAILRGAGNNYFLNIQGANVYNDEDCSAGKELNETNYNTNPGYSKFNDVSDWVYEKLIFVKIDAQHQSSSVLLKSKAFNGQILYQLGYTTDNFGRSTSTPAEKVVMGAGSTNDTYTLRVIYDYKTNRLSASWEPSDVINEVKKVDADILFVSNEGENVKQITFGSDSATARLTSLQSVMYVLEMENNYNPKTDAPDAQYWIALPFECKISDIFGIENYITLDENRIAQSGWWGIMRYRGDLRAQKGWFEEDTPEGFWEWMYPTETLVPGEGYVLYVEKKSLSWNSITVEEPCEGTEDGCQDGKKSVQKFVKRFYFPSLVEGFTMNRSGEASSKVTYPNQPCNITSPVDRRAEDSNWKVIAPKSYNNVGINTADPQDSEQVLDEQLKFIYVYNEHAEKGSRYAATAAEGFEFHAFHGYMAQYGGTITWNPYSKTEHPTSAPRFAEEPSFKGGMLTIELVQNNEQLDRTFVNLSKNGTEGFDQNLDLTKITENCAQIASISEDVLYAGNTLPLNIELVPLNVKVVANGTYDIALEKSLKGLEVNLFDAFEQTTTPLDMMSATVTLNKGEYKDRFYLQLKQKGSETPTSFEGKIEQFNLPTDKTQKLLINGNIYLINGGRIYNATGAELR